MRSSLVLGDKSGSKGAYQRTHQTPMRFLNQLACTKLHKQTLHLLVLCVFDPLDRRTFIHTHTHSTKHAHFLCAALPQGRISSWLTACLGVDPANLYPSVRCGVEGALLTALAQVHNLSLSNLLVPSQAMAAQQQTERAEQDKPAVLVNALLDCNSSIECCVAEAGRLVSQGYTAFKLKASGHPLLDHSYALHEPNCQQQIACRTPRQFCERAQVCIDL